MELTKAASTWDQVDYGVFRRPRTARRRHHCATCDAYVIQPGERHWQCAAAPRVDWNGSGRWLRMRECQDCATRYGRPVPRAVAADA